MREMTKKGAGIKVPGQNDKRYKDSDVSQSTLLSNSLNVSKQDRQQSKMSNIWELIVCPMIIDKSTNALYRNQHTQLPSFVFLNPM